MIPFKKTNRGLIKTIVIIVVILLLLAYFRVNIKNVVTSQAWIDNWEFVKSTTIHIWTEYLKVPITYIIDKMFWRD